MKPSAMGVASPTAQKQILLGPSSGMREVFPNSGLAPGQSMPTKDILNSG